MAPTSFVNAASPSAGSRPLHCLLVSTSHTHIEYINQSLEVLEAIEDCSVARKIAQFVTAFSASVLSSNEDGSSDAAAAAAAAAVAAKQGGINGTAGAGTGGSSGNNIMHTAERGGARERSGRHGTRPSSCWLYRVCQLVILRPFFLGFRVSIMRGLGGMGRIIFLNRSCRILCRSDEVRLDGV